MGSSQREATFVAIGLVIIATLVVVYMFNEPHRRETATEDKLQESIHRGETLFVTNCVPCHGPDGKAVGRIGIPLNTEQNVTTDPVLGPQREKIIRDTITNGRGAVMPAWGQENNGPLNSQQIDDLVNMIRHGPWDEVYAKTVEQAGGVEPTVPPTATAASPTDQGKTLFGQVCVACHTASPDFPNGGVVGPNLTGIGGKQTTTIGFPVDKENLTKWINDPQSIKPGTIMPPKGGATNWGDAEVSAVVDYLLSLK